MMWTSYAVADLDPRRGMRRAIELKRVPDALAALRTTGVHREAAKRGTAAVALDVQLDAFGRHLIHPN